MTAARGTRLPPAARIHYRFPALDGAASAEVEPMRLLGDRMAARRENVLRSFEFRVEGGDDRSLGWQQVEVLEPPSVAALEIKLIPPAYTGWPSQSLSGGGGIRAWPARKCR